jgi:hypothetical protein
VKRVQGEFRTRSVTSKKIIYLYRQGDGVRLREFMFPVEELDGCEYRPTAIDSD